MVNLGLALNFKSDFFSRIGTQISYYLNSITKNIVYYDPGHEIDSSNNASVRPQWRMSIRLNFEKDLMHLYKEVHHETLL